MSSEERKNKKMEKENKLQKQTIENLINENTKLKKKMDTITFLLFSCLLLGTIGSLVLLIPSASAYQDSNIIKIEPSELLPLNLYSGESFTQNITIKTDGNYLVYLSYSIENNTYDMKGFHINLPESVFVEKEKTIPIIISTDTNFKPDLFIIFLTASTERVEEEITINYTNQTITSRDLELNIDSNGTGNITIKTFIENPESGFGIPSLNKFFEITASNSIISGMNETLITIYYTDSELGNMDESTLRLYFFNTTSNLWEIYDGENGGVNATGNYVWAKTTHFSLWGIFGSVNPSSTSSSGSSSNPSSGGYCYRGYKISEWSGCNGTQNRTITIDLTKCYQTKQERPISEQVCSQTNETCTGDNCPIISGGKDKSNWYDKNKTTLIIFIIVVIVLMILTAIIYPKYKKLKNSKENIK